MYNKEYHKIYRDVHKGKRSEYNAERLLNLKLIVYNHYCNNDIKCQCPNCNENNIEFLSLDHINNDGATHRRLMGSTSTILQWIVNNNFPDGFRVLCMNCNSSYGFHGYCPHEHLSESEKILRKSRKLKEIGDICKFNAISNSDSMVTQTELKEIMQLKEII